MSPIFHNALAKISSPPVTIGSLTLLAFFIALVAGLTPAAVAATKPPVTISTPEDPRRVPGLQGAPNFRDLGGYATTDGHQVRWGRVFRSERLSRLTAADAARIDALGIAAFVDLRTMDEHAAEPSIWLHRPSQSYESSKATLGPLMRTILVDGSNEQGARRGLVAFYAQMPDLYRPEFTAMFRALANGDVPMVVHCTGGKDRTGVASALLLSALGVPRATIVKDYVLTSQLLPMPAAAVADGHVPMGGAARAEAALAVLPEATRRALWAADPAYIDAALDAVVHDYGTIDTYLKRGLGLSGTEIRSLRDHLID